MLIEIKHSELCTVIKQIFNHPTEHQVFVSARMDEFVLYNSSFFMVSGERTLKNPNLETHKNDKCSTNGKKALDNQVTGI